MVIYVERDLPRVVQCVDGRGPMYVLAPSGTYPKGRRNQAAPRAREFVSLVHRFTTVQDRLVSFCRTSRPSIIFLSGCREKKSYLSRQRIPFILIDRIYAKKKCKDAQNVVRDLISPYRIFRMFKTFRFSRLIREPRRLRRSTLEMEPWMMFRYLFRLRTLNPLRSRGSKSPESGFADASRHTCPLRPHFRDSHSARNLKVLRRRGFKSAI